MSLKQGSIVLVDFSYSNLKETKYRPALVISSSEYNEHSIDIVVLRVTSRGRDSSWELKILKNDMAEGTLDIEPSYVKVDSIYSVEKNMKNLNELAQMLSSSRSEVIRRIIEGGIEESEKDVIEAQTWL